MRPESVIVFLISFVALWWFYFTVYRDYRIDLLRQRLFEIRDRLFDLTEETDLEFHHPVYGLSRDLLNGYIRFTPSLSAITLVSWLLFGPDTEDVETFSEQVRTGSVGLSYDVRQELLEIYRDMSIAVSAHVVYTSMFSLLLVPIIGFFVVRHVRNQLTATAKEWWQRQVGDKMDVVAMAMGA